MWQGADRPVAVEDELRLLHHLPEPHRSVVGAGRDGPLARQTVDRRHTVLVAKPAMVGGGEGGGGGEGRGGGGEGRGRGGGGEGRGGEGQGEEIRRRNGLVTVPQQHQEWLILFLYT